MGILIRMCLVCSVIGLSACQRTLTITPYFDGVRTGDYIYSAEVNGAPAEVTSSVTFNVSASPMNEQHYEFEGELQWLDDTYEVTGIEELPDEVRLKAQASLISSSIRIKTVNINGGENYAFCGRYFYGTSSLTKNFGDSGGRLDVYAAQDGKDCSEIAIDEVAIGTVMLALRENWRR